MGQLRTEEGSRMYQEHRRALPADAPCPLCREVTLQDFQYWRIITNEFPYDRIAAVHHMLVPKRHSTEDTLTDAEERELLELKQGYCNDHYEFLIEATRSKKSIPAHFHLHLLVVN